MTHIYIKPDVYNKAVELIDENHHLSITRLQQELLITKDTAQKIVTQLVLDIPYIKIDE